MPKTMAETGASRFTALPACLVGLRIALAPLLWLATLHGGTGAAVILTVALLSDIFDGVIARRAGVATERRRVADSWADGWFYLWVIACVWRATPEIVRAFRAPLAAVIALQLFSYAVDLAKYRRIASFHAYSAKAWGLALFAASVALLEFHTSGIYLWCAIVMGFVSNIDGLAMRCLLPVWRHDVPSCFHALRYRTR